MTERTEPAATTHEGLPTLPRVRVGLTAFGVLAAAVLLAAHHLRAGPLGLSAAWLALPLLLLYRRRWVGHVVSAALLVGSLTWAHTAWRLVEARLALGLPYGRLLVILAAVASLTLWVAIAVGRPAMSRWLCAAEGSARTSAAASLLTLVALVPVQLITAANGRPLLLAERFAPLGPQTGAGWLEVLALAVYAAVVAEKLAAPERTAAVRRTIWILFSIVFFSQLALGLLGFERFLMRPDQPSQLHLPIPALIAAGPIYRGGGYFMLTLFLSTVVLVGPAWCSHLCYVGCWDDLAARRRRKPQIAPARRHLVRLLIAVLVISAAVGLRAAGAPTALAGGLALGFGLVGVAVILLASRRTGRMVHCTVYCPIGLLACWLGKLSPLGIEIGEGCTRCMRCRLTCRYGALEKPDIEARRPGIACTLCGDCVGACPDGQLGYRLPGLRPATARAVFIALVVALHAASLGLARI